jgi:N,N-dimethylformamidase
VLVRDGGGLALGGSGTVRCYVQPTTPALRDQALVSRWDEATRTGWWVGLSGGRLTLRLGSGTSVHETATDAPLYAWTWYAITASWHGGSMEITQRTVAHHIEHILDKLGASSRTAAARRAVEDGLRLLP